LLTKLEQATINEGIFTQIETRVREGEIVATVLKEETVQTLRCERVEEGGDVGSEFY